MPRHAALPLAAAMALALSPLCAGHPLPGEIIRYDAPTDRRPFLVRLLASVGVSLEVGAEKARLRIGPQGAELSGGSRERAALHHLFPTGAAATVKFGAEYHDFTHW